MTANLRFEGGKASGRLSTTKDGRVGMKLAQVEALTIINYPTRIRQAFNTLLLLVFDAPKILCNLGFVLRCTSKCPVHDALQTLRIPFHDPGGGTVGLHAQ